jgi:hypothetical protein
VNGVHNGENDGVDLSSVIAATWGRPILSSKENAASICEV